MKKLLTLALLSISASVWAAPDSDVETQRYKLCASQAALAEKMQRANQDGVPLGEMLAIADMATEEYSRRLARALIVLAYTEQRWSTEGAKLRAIANFRDSLHVTCLQRIGK